MDTETTLFQTPDTRVWDELLPGASEKSWAYALTYPWAVLPRGCCEGELVT